MSQTTQQPKTLFHYLTTSRSLIALNMGLGILNGLSTVFITVLIGKGIDTLIGPHQVNFQRLYSFLLLILVLTLIGALTQWGILRIGNSIAFRTVATLRKDAFTHLDSLPVQFYDTTKHGDIMSRLSTDLDTLSDALIAVSQQLFSGIAIVVFSLVVMLFLSPMLTGVVLLSTAFIFFVNWWIATTSQKHFNSQQHIIGQLSGQLQESLMALKTIKAFQQEAQTQLAFQKHNLTLQTVGQNAQFVSSLTNPLSRFIDHLGYIGVGLVGGLLMSNEHSSITLGIISSFILYSSQFSKPFIEISGTMTQFQTALAGFRRINELFAISSESKEANHSPHHFSPKGLVEWQNVSFSYDKKTPLIQGFNLTVAPGETVAIVGKTGAGKSTLVNLLMRFYEIDSGHILIDQQDITMIPRDQLRQEFGMVLQDTWLFDGTIWDNLTFGTTNATQEKVEKACREAMILPFIQQLPNGFDTQIGGNHGFDLSEGQKQLLTIARTMISEPRLLILDEATSSVDTLTEQHIQIALSQLMRGKTSFIIAHRLSTIQNADTIIVMDQGKIIEQGNHAELLKNIGGPYDTLYRAQFEDK